MVRPRARVIFKGPARLAGVAGCVDGVRLVRPAVELVGLLDGLGWGWGFLKIFCE